MALLKANPGKYSYGSSGLGSILHLCGESFKMMNGGLDVAHVPYRGSGPMMNDLSAGQIPMAFDGMPTVLPQVQAGTIRAIGMGTTTRARAMPDLPTLEEQGMKGFECYFWVTFFAPAKTPKPIITKLYSEVTQILRLGEVKERLSTIDLKPVGSTPEEFATIIKQEVPKWAKVLRESGVKQTD